MSECDTTSWLIALRKKNWVCNPKSYEEAVRIQRNVTKIAEDVWGKVIGYKVALTSPQSQKMFGGGPISGPLFSFNILGKGSAIYLNELSDPLLEPEIFLCEDKFHLAFEIPDNRYGKKWKQLNWLQLLADLAGSYKVVVGDPVESLKGKIELLDSEGNLIASSFVDEFKIRKNMMLLKDFKGCIVFQNVYIGEGLFIFI